jgi:hypothetical protein
MMGTLRVKTLCRWTSLNLVCPALVAIGLLSASSAGANCRISDLYQTASPERFVKSDDATVTDNVTGLMWQLCILGLSGDNCGDGAARFLTWSDALSAATASNAANFDDWRIPNIKELASLIEYACTAPAMDQTLFPNTGISRPDSDEISYIVWSATPYYDSALIRYIDFSNASDNALNRDTRQLVRLVRSID